MNINVELALVVKMNEYYHYFIISTPELILNLISLVGNKNNSSFFEIMN